MPAKITLQDLLKKRKEAMRPDPSFNLAGDAGISAKEFRISKYFDKDKDGRLNSQERANAVKALKEGIELERNKSQESIESAAQKSAGSLAKSKSERRFLTRTDMLTFRKQQFIDAEEAVLVKTRQRLQSAVPKSPTNEIVATTDTGLIRVQSEVVVKGMNIGDTGRSAPKFKTLH